MEDQEQRQQQVRESRQRQRERQNRIRQTLTETLDRAVADVQFRQMLIDDPRMLFGTAEGRPQERKASEVPEEAQRLRIAMLRQVVDRALTDQEFRTQLEKHPRQAMWQFGFGAQIEQIRAEMIMDDVRGYYWTTAPTGFGGWHPTLIFTGWGGW